MNGRWWVHLSMHACTLLTASFGDRRGCTVAYANPLGDCMLLPEGDALPERIRRRASANDELLGGGWTLECTRGG